MMNPTLYQANYKQSVAILGRHSHYWLRSRIRFIRRNCPDSMDVKYYADSLALEPYGTDATVRHAYCWQTRAWVKQDRHNTATNCPLNVGVIGPVGKLP